MMADRKSRTGPAIPFAAGADLTRLSKVRPEEVRARVRQPVSLADSLSVQGPGNAAAGLAPNSMVDGTKYEIPLAKIRPYDRNPRKSSNAAFDEIKASLRATGRESLELWVTQRPSHDWYMPYRGGNTRLAAIKDLFQEGDLRWERLIVVYKVWVSEADTLAQHLIENNNRAEMTFWDKACAYLIDLRAEIESEVGEPVSIRRLENELAKRGVGVGKSRIALFQFAVERLARIGPYLSARQVIQMQPAINLMIRLAEKFSIDAAMFQGMLDAVLEALRAKLEGAKDESASQDGLRAEAILSALETALASKLGTVPGEMRRWLDTLSRFPDASAEEMRSGAPARKPAKPAPSSPAPPNGASNESGTSSQASHAQTEDAAQASIGPDSPAAPADIAAVVEQTEVAAPVVFIPPSFAAPATPLEAARTFAQSAQVADCLRVCPAVPAGFYIEIPAPPLDMGMECPNHPHRIIAWQLLAVLSGQWDETPCRSLPADSLWRRMRLCEGGLDADALPMLLQDQLLVDIGGQNITPGAESLGWGPAIHVGWVVRLLTDPDCAGALSGLLLHFAKRGSV